MKKIKLTITALLIIAALAITGCSSDSKTEQSDNVPKVILDCDMGYMNDDALALAMLLKADEAGKVKLLGITLEGGNTFIDASYNNSGSIQKGGYENTREFLSAVHRDNVPVKRGTDFPKGYSASEEEKLAAFFDGLKYAGFNSGYGAVHFFNRIESGKLTDCDDASEFMIDMAGKYPGEVVILTIGPVMNLARAVEKDETFAEKIDAVYYMAGAFGEGNLTRYAEYNVCYDAASFDICLKAGFKQQYMSPAENNIGIDRETADKLKEKNINDNGMADLWCNYYDTYIQDYPYWDPLATAAFLNPENAMLEECYVTVNTDRADDRYGMTQKILPDEYEALSENGKSAAGKIFVITGYKDFWNFTIDLLCR